MHRIELTQGLLFAESESLQAAEESCLKLLQVGAAVGEVDLFKSGASLHQQLFEGGEMLDSGERFHLLVGEIEHAERLDFSLREASVLVGIALRYLGQHHGVGKLGEGHIVLRRLRGELRLVEREADHFFDGIPDSFSRLQGHCERLGGGAERHQRQS